MEVSLSIAEDEAAEGLADLAEWLSREPGLRGLVTPVVPTPIPGRLSALADALSVAVGAGGALSALATSLKVYFAQPRRSDVRIVIHLENGGVVDIDAHRVDRVEELVRDALDRTTG